MDIFASEFHKCNVHQPASTTYFLQEIFVSLKTSCKQYRSVNFVSILQLLRQLCGQQYSLHFLLRYVDDVCPRPHYMLNNLHATVGIRSSTWRKTTTPRGEGWVFDGRPPNISTFLLSRGLEHHCRRNNADSIINTEKKTGVISQFANWLTPSFQICPFE